MSDTVGKLYIVGTPIGNLKDITLRALEVLSTVPVIACEDTRHTKVLLHEHDIFTKNPEVKLVSFHTHSKTGERSSILKTLADGKDIALVSDAGTPCISDPGTLLLEEIRTYNKTVSVDEQISIVPIPGASALVTALSAFGVMGGRFEFVGFIPHKKGRETLIKHMIASEIPVVCYESPHRIMKTLESLTEAADEEKKAQIAEGSDGDDKAVDFKLYVGRELTKMFEDIMIGSPAEILDIFKKNEDTKDRKDRGEFVLMIERL